MTNRKFGIAFFLMGLMLALVPRYILPVCEYQGYNPMSCSNTAVAEMFAGSLVMTASIALLFLRGTGSLRWLSLAILVSGISVLWIPEAIGYCRSDRMPCNYATVPVLRLLGVLLILSSLAGFLLSFKEERKSTG